eukprot:3768148-Prymnesium_polylepis.1
MRHDHGGTGGIDGGGGTLGAGMIGGERGGNTGRGGDCGVVGSQHSCHPMSVSMSSDVHVIMPPATRTSCGPLVPQ